MEDEMTNYVSVNENFKAYKVFQHQHLPEIQQYWRIAHLMAPVDKGAVLFTAHLLPLNRGILCTIYLHFNNALSVEQVRHHF